VPADEVAELFRYEGLAVWEVREHGALVDRGVQRNIMVDNGRIVLTSKLHKTTDAYAQVLKLGIGSGTTATAVSDTAVEGLWGDDGFEAATLANGTSEPCLDVTTDTKKATAKKIWTNDNAGARAVGNFGIYTTGDVLYAKATISGGARSVAGASAGTFSLTWTLQFP
jgi:hypothetical protein